MRLGGHVTNKRCHLLCPMLGVLYPATTIPLGHRLSSASTGLVKGNEHRPHLLGGVLNQARGGRPSLPFRPAQHWFPPAPKVWAAGPGGSPPCACPRGMPGIRGGGRPFSKLRAWHPENAGRRGQCRAEEAQGGIAEVFSFLARRHPLLPCPCRPPATSTVRSLHRTSAALSLNKGCQSLRSPHPKRAGSASGRGRFKDTSGVRGPAPGERTVLSRVGGPSDVSMMRDGRLGRRTSRAPHEQTAGSRPR